MGLLEIIDRFRGNSNMFNNLKLQDLNVEKIKLERREKLLTGDTRRLEQSLKDILKSGRDKGTAERLILARKFDEGDKQIKLTNLQLRRLSTQIKMLNQLKFIQENRAQMEESGLLKRISEMPEEQLEEFLQQVNVTDLLQTGNTEAFVKKLDTEWGLQDSIEPTIEEKTLLDIWESNVEQPLEEVRANLEEARRTEDDTDIEKPLL